MLGTSNIIWNLINFIALIFLLVKFLKKPVTDAVEKKRDSISTRLDDLESKLNSATEKLNHQNKQLEEVKVDLKKIEEQSKDMAERLHEDIIKTAHSEAEKVKVQMKKAMEQEINRTKDLLRKEIIEKSLLKAHDVIKQKLDDNTQVSLIQSFAMSLNAKSSDN
ncbi:MAG: F0F1 ATP synthase subunit B [Cyanobacteriota bacterium]